MNKKRMIQIAMILCGILLLLTLFANLFRIFGQTETGSTTKILICESVLLTALLFLGLLQSRSKYVAFRKRKKVSGTSAEELRSLIGKKVVVTTFIEVFNGILVEVEGDWLKIKDKDMRPTVHILRSDMILSITVK